MNVSLIIGKPPTMKAMRTSARSAAPSSVKA
jgi:hypothetical protein